LGLGEREDRKTNLVEINLKRLGDRYARKVDLIALGDLDLKATVIQGNLLHNKENPSKD